MGEGITRSLHLIDLDNLAGSPAASAGEARAALDDYRTVIRVGRDDLTLVAVNANNAAMVFAARDGVLDPCQIKVGHGTDGADLALLRTWDADRIAQRFSRLVIGSGDHIFAELAESLVRRRVPVTVASRRRSLAGSLKRAATDVRYLPDLPCDQRAVIDLRQRRDRAPVSLDVVERASRSPNTYAS